MLTRKMILGMIVEVLGFLVASEVSIAAELLVPSQYSKIQYAINAAQDGDTVTVADGTYTGAGNRSIEFKGKAITVRSQNGPENCIVDCEQTTKGFMFDNNEDANSVLDGFTIENSKTVGSDKGIAIWCGNGTSPTITDCVITHNSNYAFRCGSTATPTISDCVITDNSGTAIHGGRPTLSDCIIMGNSGWGIDCEYHASISRCIIGDNWGGIEHFGGSATVDNCLIKDNTSHGISYTGTAANERLLVTNCTIVGNRNGVYTTGVVTLVETSIPTRFLSMPVRTISILSRTRLVSMQVIPISMIQARI